MPSGLLSFFWKKSHPSTATYQQRLQVKIKPSSDLPFRILNRLVWGKTFLKSWVLTIKCMDFLPKSKKKWEIFVWTPRFRNLPRAQTAIPWRRAREWQVWGPQSPLKQIHIFSIFWGLRPSGKSQQYLWKWGEKHGKTLPNSDEKPCWHPPKKMGVTKAQWDDFLDLLAAVRHGSMEAPPWGNHLGPSHEVMVIHE